MEKIPIDQEAKARLWAKNHPEFIRPDSDLLKVKKVKPMSVSKVPTKKFTCKYCAKEFAYKAVHQKHLTSCTAQIKEDTIKPISKPTATLPQPAVSEDLLRAIAEDTAKKPYKPQTGAPWPGPKAETTTPAPTMPAAPWMLSTGYVPLPAPPATGSPTAPAPQPTVSRKVDAVYYLLVGILSAVALCLMVAAALGIKLLVGL